MVNELTERKEAARAFIMTLVEESFDGMSKGEWMMMVKAQNKKENGDEMED